MTSHAALQPDQALSSSERVWESEILPVLNDYIHT